MDRVRDNKLYINRHRTAKLTQNKHNYNAQLIIETVKLIKIS